MFAGADDSQNTTFVTNALMQMVRGNERERNLSQVEQPPGKSSLCEEAPMAVADDPTGIDVSLSVSQDERRQLEESGHQNNPTEEPEVKSFVSYEAAVSVNESEEVESSGTDSRKE